MDEEEEEVEGEMLHMEKRRVMERGSLGMKMRGRTKKEGEEKEQMEMRKTG